MKDKHQIDYPIPSKFKRMKEVEVIEFTCPHCEKRFGEDYDVALSHVRIPLEPKKLPTGFIYKSGIKIPEWGRSPTDTREYFRIILPEGKSFTEDYRPYSTFTFNNKITEDHSYLQWSVQIAFDYSSIECGKTKMRGMHYRKGDFLGRACQTSFGLEGASFKQIKKNQSKFLLNQDELEQVILNLEHHQLKWYTPSFSRKGIDLRELYPLKRKIPRVNSNLDKKVK